MNAKWGLNFLDRDVNRMTHSSEESDILNYIGV